MADKAQTTDVAAGGDETPTPPTPATPPKRSPGHRGADVRDTVAEMTARAHEISLEAGSRMAGAMKDVINAAAGLAGFAMESARDLVQYMVRRGQMTQEEGDKLLRDAEEAQARRRPPAPQPEATPADSKPAAKKAAKSAPEPPPHPPAAKKAAEKAPAKTATKTAPARASAEKAGTKTAAKAAKKAPAAKTPAKAAAKKSAAKKR
jgi:hypothetical protein